MPKLSDTQAALLAAAAARPDLSVLPPPETLGLKGAALERTLKALSARGLIAAAPVESRAKRSKWADPAAEAGERERLIVTPAGRAAIAAKPGHEAAAVPSPDGASPQDDQERHADHPALHRERRRHCGAEHRPRLAAAYDPRRPDPAAPGRVRPGGDRSGGGRSQAIPDRCGAAARGERLMQRATQEEVSREIATLLALDRAGCLDRWQTAFDRPPPKHLSLAFMRQVLAHQAQVAAFGGLSAKTRRALASALKEPASTRRRVAAGARLVREWNGSTHEVEVLAEGFLFRGQRFRSLSAIAREITGARWSGPRFFGVER